MEKNFRTRNWLFVFYPDSCPEDWESVIESWCVSCYVSPLHDLDVTKDGELKKAHYHGVLVFDGVKSYSQVMALVSELGCSTCKVCNSLQNSLRYLCHLDSQDKAQYSVSDVKLFGHVDLAPFYERSSSEQNLDVADLLLLAKEQNILEFHTLVDVVVDDYFDTYWPSLRANASFFRAYFQSLHYSHVSYSG